jgi:RHS repeat-associated protein
VKQKYTGYERDAETNLNYAEARYHSDTQGRFTSVDPLSSSAKLTDPQSFNRYSYVSNKPTIYSDPSGMSVHLGGRNISNFNGAMAAEEHSPEFAGGLDVPIETSAAMIKDDAALDSVGTDGKAAADTDNQNIGTVTQDPAQQQIIEDPELLVMCGPNSNVTDASQLPPLNTGLNQATMANLQAADVLKYIDQSTLTSTEGPPFNDPRGVTARFISDEARAALIADLGSRVDATGNKIFSHGRRSGNEHQKEVGNVTDDFRGRTGYYGKGSLQITIGSRFYADHDRFNPRSGDLAEPLGHILLEAIPHRIRSIFRNP